MSALWLQSGAQFTLDSVLSRILTVAHASSLMTAGSVSCFDLGDLASSGSSDVASDGDLASSGPQSESSVAHVAGESDSFHALAGEQPRHSHLSTLSH